MIKKSLFYFLVSIIFFVFLYFSIGFYLAHRILFIDHSCGVHEGSLPNKWSTYYEYENHNILAKKNLRKNFNSTEYHLNNWEDVIFPSREKDVKISGWLFNYHPNKPIVIIVHGIFPNGKCKPESNLIASLLVRNDINALTIDLRNYGQSSHISNYENLGLTEYKDVLGAFDFLQTKGFKKNQIGLLGISLGASTVIYASFKEQSIKAIWSESSLAEFNMILKDEISSYSMPHIFGPSVSLAGQIMTGIDPTKLSPAYLLSKKQNYFFTHGDKDQRILPKHFYFFKKIILQNELNADFWLVKNAYHVDAMLMYPEEYGLKMKNFFEKNLN